MTIVLALDGLAAEWSPSSRPSIANSADQQIGDESAHLKHRPRTKALRLSFASPSSADRRRVGSDFVTFQDVAARVFSFNGEADYESLESVTGAEDGATRAGPRSLSSARAIKPGTVTAKKPATSTKGTTPDPKDRWNRVDSQERSSNEIGRRNITRAINVKRPATIAASDAIGPATRPHPPKDPNTSQAIPWIAAAPRAYARCRASGISS